VRKERTVQVCQCKEYQREEEDERTMLTENLDDDSTLSTSEDTFSFADLAAATASTIFGGLQQCAWVVWTDGEGNGFDGVG
jgi:hypothetical protein